MPHPSLPARSARVAARLVGTGVLASLVVSASLRQDGEVDRLEEEIRTTLAEIHTLRSEKRTLAESSELEIRVVEGQISRLETDLEEVRVYVADHTSKRAEIEAEIAAADAFGERAKTFLDRLSRDAKGTLDAWRGVVDEGIAWRRVERLDQLDRLSTALEGSGEERERALLEFWAFVGEELRLSHTIDERNEEVPLAGGARAAHAYVLRLGLLQEIFATEDGSAAGVHLREDSWSETLPVDVTAGLFELIEIARGRSAADLVSAPFPSARIGAEEAGQ